MAERAKPLEPDSLLADLNEAQREAVMACSGPVVIIAGAGTGKTRVLARRAAYAIATESVSRDQVLLVTFTDKAAAEMRERLAALGLSGVLARTFHAQARSILMHFWSDGHAGVPLPEVAPSKVPLLIPLIRNLPGGYRFTAPKDLATEIEWAKARMIAPNRYAARARDRETPLPLNLMARIYASYEQAKARAGKIDFDDMLTMTVELLSANEPARTIVQSRKSWISVDEYQDTNPLQERLLALWLGASRDICVVGDEDQTIYTFTGADPAYLTGFASRWPGARTIELSHNYRSSPQVLTLANRLIAASGRGKRLVATQPDGPAPAVLRLRDDEAETAMIAARARELIAAGLAPSQIAVLVRTNAQLPPIEQALGAAGLPYLVRGGLFFSRPEVIEAIHLLRERPLRGAGAALRRAIERLWREEAGYDAAGTVRGEEARSRAASFATLLEILAVLLAAEPTADLPGYLSELDTRARQEQAGSADEGINLLTYHRAKGLEWEAVFLPSLEEGLLPIAQAIKRPSGLAEERRLLYVGITRARAHLILSYAETRLSPTGKRPRRLRSRFLDGLGAPATGYSATGAAKPAGPEAPSPAGPEPAAPRSQPSAASAQVKDDSLYLALCRWRADRARADGVPAYVVAPNGTLEALAAARPARAEELPGVRGLGPARISRYGQEILAICAAQSRAASGSEIEAVSGITAISKLEAVPEIEARSDADPPPSGAGPLDPSTFLAPEAPTSRQAAKGAKTAKPSGSPIAKAPIAEGFASEGAVIELLPAASFELETSAPFDFRLSLWKPSHFPSRLERHSQTETWRTFRLASGRPTAVGLRPRAGGPGLEVQVWAQGAMDLAERAEIEARLRAGYGLDVDLSAFYAAVITDSPLASGPITRLYGMRPSCPENLFEILVISLLLQNTTVARSAQMLDSVSRAFGDQVSVGGHRLSVFADPRRLAGSSEAFLREQCRLGYRAKYLVPLAEIFARGGLTAAEIASSDPAGAEAKLCALPGVGPYSARVALALVGGAQIALDTWNTKLLSEFLFGRPEASAPEVRAEADKRWGRYQALSALYVIEDIYRDKPLSPIAQEDEAALLSWSAL